ncbi:MAG TPA: PilT/PilU family type 4a pilus ATPase [Candidatus Paceibacterota bacterium]|nr:PilT/PilU family type 4a pilus ATPase [Candidatus Paceibacterota bacterium]
MSDTRIHEFLDTVVKEGGSDLHLSPGSPPIIRVSGALVPLVQESVLTPADTAGMLKAVVPESMWEKFEADQAVDFSLAHTDGNRFRVNGYVVQGAVVIAMRLIPRDIRTFETLNLPPVLEVFSQRQQGFFLVVGPVGQGKSTTLAAIIDRINETRAEHIVTIEDPVEYIFEQKKSLIHQREVHIDTPDFAAALTSAFREDVNVIMVGEMRNYETISAAVTAAETGHLVLSTLHTNNAAQTIDRIIDMFPPNQQGQVRVQLAGSLAGIFSQRLVPKISGGLVPAYELLINNSAIANLIREGRTHEISTVIQTSSQEGMIDMDRSLAELVRRGEVTIEHAYERAMDPKTFERYL